MKKYTYNDIRSIKGVELSKLSKKESKNIYRQALELVSKKLIGTEKRRGILTQTADKLLKNPDFAVPHSISFGLDKKKLQPYLKGRDKFTREENKKIRESNAEVINKWVNYQKERLMPKIDEKSAGYVGKLHGQLRNIRDFLNAESVTMAGHKRNVYNLINTLTSELKNIGYVTDNINESNISDIYRVYDLVTQRPKGSKEERYELYRSIVRVVNSKNAETLTLQEIATILNNEQEDKYLEDMKEDEEEE